MSFTRNLASVFAVVVFSSAQADIINVGPGDSIQDAIVAAMDGDEIVVAPSTYFEAISFNGKAITVRSSDGAEVTIISANGPEGADSAVTCESGEPPATVLQGFTVRGCNASRGGVMYCLDSSPSVLD